MQQQFAQFLYTYKDFAILLSILINVIISIIGFIPSVFLTAINIKLFGLAGGFTLSLIGEALGALMSFWLYRLGFRKFVEAKVSSHPKVQQLLSVRGREAFLLILSLRLIPFIPSSLVTLYAALGSVSWILFAFASTIGKVPALVMEVYSVNEVMKGSLLGKVIVGLLVLGILVYVWRLKKRK
ncbi:VTT domain-containing protein [Shimazuella sp. AN120528]|uniref:TVP38/TMEM64 family protein n=1 Tax=Shimazuella soli TaxID=1892854 RepID=UPI001F0DAA83|nr:VTT domain-containing protein [Shimazuella soli]MCH5584088.1 VTT domain-containing protein [Shimazuella soli]